MSKYPVVAIVDDDLSVREALSDFLEVEGIASRTFENGSSFLSDGPAERFDCLITDVKMPEVDGLELIERLRAQGSAIPVIFITSVMDDKTRASAMAKGAFAWFTKPVANDDLLKALQAAIPPGDGPTPPAPSVV